jgi:protein disulfide-isomerase A6
MMIICSDIVFVAVDATVATKTAEFYQIKGYPSIKFFPKGRNVDSPLDYPGGRTAPDLIK